MMETEVLKEELMWRKGAETKQILNNDMDTYETHILVKKKTNSKPSNPTIRIMKP